MASESRAGRCHCGAVLFTVAVPDEPVVRRCNCSICAMKGVVMLDVPMRDVSITRGEDNLALYRFGSGAAEHRFCKTCGIHPFHRLRSDNGAYGVNVACIEGMSPYDWPEMPVYDGQAHERDSGVSRDAGVMRFERFSD